MNSRYGLNIFELLFFFANLFIGFIIAISLVKIFYIPKWLIIPLGIATSIIWISFIVKIMNNREAVNEERWVLNWMNANKLSNDDLMDRIKIVQSAKAKAALQNELNRRNNKSA